MKLLETRIDDRLVHGQIVTTWIQATRADTIVVADDNAANDSFQQTILKMATPEGIKLIIKSLSDAATMFKADQSNMGALLIVRSASDARTLLESGIRVDKITLGNITNKKSNLKRKMILKYVFASQEDADNLMAISKMGVKLVAQTVPGEKSYDIMELMKKAGFYN